MSPTERILLVEDDEEMRASCRQALEGAGHEVTEAGSALEAEPILLRQPFELVITDLRMPHGGGQEVLRLVKRISPEVPVLVITAYPSVESAVEAFRGGVADYLLKPFTSEQLVDSIDRALRARRAGERAAIVRKMGHNGPELGEMTGGSPKFRAMLAEVRKVAALDGSVLVWGETGSGKELVARAIHRFSKRSAGPLITVNCAAIPENLIEAELFGFERGAFTGATNQKNGLFEEAHQGTLFLDEVAELSAVAQAKLLRCLEDKAVRRLGSVTPRPVDARIVCATHKRLWEEERAKRFRGDLLYRLAVLEISVPPLRERPEDVPALAITFLDELRRREGREIVGFSDEALDRLVEHAWPGNVRELQNAVQRAFARAGGPIIEADDVQLDTTGREPSCGPVERTTALAQFERGYITETLTRHEGNVTHAAHALGIHRTTLQRVLKKLSISADDYR